jgi:peroxiredoxin Q/BCP
VGFRDEFQKIQAAHGVVIGVSPDPPERLRRFRAKNDLPFVLLSDPDHQVAETYGVWGEKKMYGKTFQGIVRSHFVIDEEGRVVDAQIKVSPKKSVELAVAALEH